MPFTTAQFFGIFRDYNAAVWPFQLGLTALGLLDAMVVYPLLGALFGHAYMESPTFGLPCPTTIFTFGLLMFLVEPFPRLIFAVPILWAAVGSLAAFRLGVP